MPEDSHMSTGQKPYTVVLLRPDYIANDLYGTDVYVFVGPAGSWWEAVWKGREEVFKADTRDNLEPVDPNDYALVVAFQGECNPVAFSFSE